MQKVKIYTNFTLFPLLTALYRKKLFFTQKSFIRILIIFQSQLIVSASSASGRVDFSRKKTGMSRPDSSG